MGWNCIHFLPLTVYDKKSTLQEGNGRTEAKQRVPVGGLHPGKVEIWNWRRQLGRYDAVQNTLRLELAGLTFKHLTELKRNVVEGIYHTGTLTMPD